MHTNRHQRIASASRRVRRVRRRTGRILASALGFGVAYYFDRESGGARRQRLAESLQRTARVVDSRLASEAGDPPSVFVPLLRVLRQHDDLRPHDADTASAEPSRVRAVAP